MNLRENFEEAIQLARKTIRMTVRAQSEAHFLGIEKDAYVILTTLLIREGRDEEARDALRSLETIVGVKRAKSKSRIFETLYRTGWGLAWTMDCLRAVAREYRRKGKHADAAELMGRTLAMLDGIPLMDQPTFDRCQCFEIQRKALFDAGDMLACITCCQRYVEFLNRLPPSDLDGLKMHYQRETYSTMGWCFARLDNFDQAKAAFLQAINSAQPMDDGKLQEILKVVPDLAYSLLLTGSYKQCAKYLPKTIAPSTVAEEEAAYTFGRMQRLADKLKGMGIIKSDFKKFLRTASLLKAAEDLKPRNASADAEWWIHKASWLNDPPVPAFRCELASLYLKAMDIVLCDADLAPNTINYYRDLAAGLFEMGDEPAAALVSADGVSRYFTDNSSPFWWGLLLQGAAALYGRRFEQTLLLLRSAWTLSRWDGPRVWILLVFFVQEYLSTGKVIAGLVQQENTSPSALVPSSNKPRSC
jgi:tetratricopeptide (TPR) repeat protein